MVPAHASMDDDQITAYLIKHLSESDDPDDLILDLCQRTGRGWPDNQAMVERVKAEHSQDITKRQFPLLSLIALFVFIGGMGLLIWAIVLTVADFRQIVSIGRSSVLNFALGEAAILSYVFGPLTFGLFGIAMILGSLLGMRDAWSDILIRK